MANNKKRDTQWMIDQDELENMVHNIKELTSHEIMGERGSLENAILLMQCYEWRALRILMAKQFVINNPADNGESKALVKKSWTCNICDAEAVNRDGLLLHYSNEHMPQDVQAPQAVRGTASIMGETKKA